MDEWFELLEWSAKVLRRTGLSHCLHLTMPICSLRGVEPNTLMSFAESHAVGGDGREPIWVGGISEGSTTALSQSVRTGVGDCSFFSWMVIAEGEVKERDLIGFSLFDNFKSHYLKRCTSEAHPALTPSNVFYSSIQDPNRFCCLPTSGSSLSQFPHHRCRCPQSPHISALSLTPVPPTLILKA